MVKKVVCILIALIWAVPNASAIDYDLIKCDQYTIDDGLPQSYIGTIFQDPDGYLWVATQDGISKFNGYEFKNYFFDPYNENSLGSNSAREIKNWSNDTLFFTTSSGISLLDIKTDEFKNYQLTEYNNNIGTVTSCEILTNRNVLVGSSRGLFFVHIDDSLADNDIQRISDTVQVKNIQKFNDQIFFTSKNKLYEFVDHKIKLVHTYPSKILNAFSSTREFCLSFEDQFLRYESLNTSPKIFNVPAIVTSCLSVGSEFWLGTKSQGVIIYDSENDDPIQWLKNQGTKNRLLSDNIKCIYQDNFGIIWLGSDKGLNKIDPSKQQFLHFKASSFSPEADNNCWSFFEKDSLFYSGYSNGIQIENKKSHTFQWIPFSGHVLDFESYQNQLFVATNQGVFTIEQADTGFALTPSGIKLDTLNPNKDLVFDLALYNDYLLIGAMNGIGIVNTDLEVINHIELSNVRGFSQKDEKVYFAAFPTGVYHLTRMDKPQHASFKKEMILPVSQLVSLCIERIDNDLWIGLYGGGLIKYNLSNKEAKHYSTNNGLPNNSVYSIIPDNQGFLWMSTNGGLSKFHIESEKFYNYNTNDGVQSLEFNSGAHYKGDQNKLFFGGINGFNIVNTSGQIKNNIPPKVHISAVLYNGKNLLNPEEGSIELDENRRLMVTIPHYKNSFTVQVDGIHYSSPEENSYSYILEGYENKQTIQKNKREFYYHNLPAGDYYFRVKAANSDAQWSKEEKIIHIVIKPPFYLSWWFITIASIVLALIIFIIIYSRVNMAKRQRAVLERKVRERTREVEKQKSILEEQKDLIEAEKNKEEELLLNVLPRETARELISTGRSTPKHYEMATVMFADFKNFTKITENLGPKELVAELDDSFARFDDIVGQFNIEKIKTSGDAYMCVGGVPIRNRTNAVDCVLAAFRFQKYMEEKRNIRDGTGKPQWHLRIGLHTGELVAGVVGKKKFLYDVWGDTVNTAARMETSSDPGRVNVSGTTYQFIKDYFDCEYRGKLPVKNKGAIDMHYVSRIKPELSEDENGLIPNKQFFELLNFKVYSQQNYNKVKDVVFNKLKQELPNDLYYHGPHHTLDVMEAAERIGRSEGLSEEDLMLVKLAALFHDSGFLNKYRDNEVEGAKFAKEFLPKYGFTDQQVELVEGMILATQIPQKPTNHLEEIICDADLDYLGRSREEFEEISDSLAKELVEYKFLKKKSEWDPIQVKFLESHSYFTDTCKKERRPAKIERLREIRDRIAGPTG